MSFSFIAISDVHFDEPSVMLQKDILYLEDEKKKAFQKAVDEAIDRDVSVFLIGGDLYHEEALSFETMVFLRKCFLTLSNNDIKICYAHGEIDKSPVCQMLKTPNLIEFSHDIEWYDISKDGVSQARIYASGYSRDTKALADKFEIKNSDIITIGMMYEKEAYSKDAILLQEILAGNKYNLFLLSGYHYYVPVRPEHNLYYLGSPTGVFFGDRPGGIMYGKADGEGTLNLDKIAVSGVSFKDIEVKDTTEQNITSLKKRLEAEIQQTNDIEKSTIIRVILSGRCALSDKLSSESLRNLSEELSATMDKSAYVIKENLTPIIDKGLLIGTSPLIESLKLIDSYKNDRQKFERLLSDVGYESMLFYDRAEDKDKMADNILDGLTDTICRVMIREENNED